MCFYKSFVVCYNIFWYISSDYLMRSANLISSSWLWKSYITEFLFHLQLSPFYYKCYKIWLRVPWRRCQNTQSMLFPCLFREYIGHISPLLWGTHYHLLCHQSDWVEGKTNTNVISLTLFSSSLTSCVRRTQFTLLGGREDFKLHFLLSGQKLRYMKPRVSQNRNHGENGLSPGNENIGWPTVSVFRYKTVLSFESFRICKHIICVLLRYTHYIIEGQYR